MKAADLELMSKLDFQLWLKTLCMPCLSLHVKLITSRGMCLNTSSNLSMLLLSLHFDTVPAGMQAAAKLEADVFSYDPARNNLPVNQIKLLLCGGVGAGKSSIVSTVDSLCQKRISSLAPHGQGTGSMTRKLRKYGFVDPATKQPVHWKLWDSMGWGTNDYRQGELNYILDGHLPNRSANCHTLAVKY